MNDDESALKPLIPLLDESLLQLQSRDRRALILRFFENKSLREVGAELGVSEDAAQKQVARALEKLAVLFRRHGYALPTTAVLAAALQQASPAPPAGLAVLVAKGVALEVGASALPTLAVWLAKFMTLTKLQITAACLIAGAIPVVYQWNALCQGQAEQARLTSEVAALQQDVTSQKRSVALLASRLRDVQSAPHVQASVAQPKTLAPAPNLFLWDEQSDYIRLPKKMTSHLTFGAFDLEPRLKAKPERVQRSALAKDGTPAPALLDALGLTAEEAQRVTDATQKAFADFASLAASRSYLTNQKYTAEGSITDLTLVTPKVPEQGSAIRQQLTDALTAVMGLERTQTFYHQAALVFRDELNEFGNAPEEVRLCLDRNRELRMDEERFNPDGTYRGSWSSSGRWLRPVPDPLKPYAEMLQRAARPSQP